MTPKKANGAESKRKASASPAPDTSKKAKSNGHASKEAELETYGIVDRRFYPREISHARCLDYNAGKITRPIEELESALKDTEADRAKTNVDKAVVHWFKNDLRIKDNKSLHLAAEMAKSKGVPLITVYLASPQDWEAHLTSAIRVDFGLRSLEVLKKDLAQLDIPIYMETVEKRRDLPKRLLELCSKWGAKHLFTNTEYEVDELRREARLVRDGLKKGIAVDITPDTCVVSPGELASGSGNQYAVYSPWFRAWVAFLHSHPDHLKIYDPPNKNPAEARKAFKELFDSDIPTAPKNKSLSSEEKKRFVSMWPAGEHEAQDRLEKFLKEKIGKYTDLRNLPAAEATAVVSVHFSAGTLSARSAVVAAQEANSTKKLDGGNKGITGWISEVAWRDFYKHVLAHWPFVCMNKCFKPEYTNIDWEYNQDNFRAWQEGKTGYPIVDAAMRQLAHMGYMHNRCRMITASFLAKDLMLDWRMGEQFFMKQLIDGDFASNNGGWGFSASCGVDPQPYFRIFNPLLQSEKFDPDGEYIRQWVPELNDIQGKAIHDPYGRGKGAEAKKNGYPEAIVEHKFARDRALSRYKAGLDRDTA